MHSLSKGIDGNGETDDTRTNSDVYLALTLLSSISEITMNHAQPFLVLSSPPMVVSSPFINCFVVLTTCLPSPMRVTSTLGPSNSLITMVHLSLILNAFVPREGTKPRTLFTS